MIGGGMLQGSTTPPAPPLSGLLAYWKLDGNGDDYTGDHPLTVNNASFTGGKINQGVQVFTGGDSLIATNGVNPTAGLTVAAWVYAYQHANYYTIVAHMIGGGGPGPTTNYHLIQFPNGDVGLLGAGDVGFAPNGCHAHLNTWTHFVATRTLAGYVELWRNGTFFSASTMPGPVSLPSVGTRIGCRADNYSVYPGVIDEVAIFGEVISNAAIAELYNAGAGKQPPFSF